MDTCTATRPCRMVATAAVGVTLLAAGCGSAAPATATGSPDYQKDVAFAHCMRSHGVPDWPDPLPQSGFPRGRGHPDTPQSTSALATCWHLLPVSRPDAAQQQRDLAQDLRWARCMRSHGFPGFSDPAVRPHAGIVITAPPDFNPDSPVAHAASNACKRFQRPVIISQVGTS